MLSKISLQVYVLTKGSLTRRSLVYLLEHQAWMYNNFAILCHYKLGM